MFNLIKNLFKPDGVPDYRYVMKKCPTRPIRKSNWGCKGISEYIANWAKTQKTLNDRGDADNLPDLMYAGVVLVPDIWNGGFKEDGHQVCWIYDLDTMRFLDYELKKGIYERRDLKDLYYAGELKNADTIKEKLKHEYDVDILTPQESIEMWMLKNRTVDDALNK